MQDYSKADEITIGILRFEQPEAMERRVGFRLLDVAIGVASPVLLHELKDAIS